jgi:hypothetical protein
VIINQDDRLWSVTAKELRQITDGTNPIPLIVEPAPDFEAETTQGHLNFPEAFSGKKGWSPPRTGCRARK